MRPIIIVILLLTAFTGTGYCLDVFKTEVVYTEQFDNASMPTDIVFNSRNSFSLYDAMKGEIREYKRYKLFNTVKNKDFIGGNCLLSIEGTNYLCNSSQSRILLLDKKFTLKGSIQGKDNDKNFDPTDLVDYKNNIFIVDNDNHRLAIYDKETKAVTGYFGKKGSVLGSFNYPFSIVIDKDGYMFVSEVINTRIQMVTPGLRGSYAIGKWGINSGELYRPKGLVLYKNKYLIVSDGYLGVLQIFDLKGHFVGVLGDGNGNIKRYPSPTRIRIFEDYIGVVDPYGRYLEIIRMEGLK